MKRICFIGRQDLLIVNFSFIACSCNQPDLGQSSILESTKKTNSNTEMLLTTYGECDYILPVYLRGDRDED